MIRVAVLYPNESGKKFDMDYYLNKHVALVNNTLSNLGLERVEVDKGMASLEPGSPPPFVAIGYMYYEDMDALQRCMTKADELMSDMPNFTDIQPQMQISEIA
jgi:uncharacterized protein (TIGR02118 family)